MKQTYTVDITAYGHVSTIKIEADSERQAIERAMEKKGISITVRTHAPSLDKAREASRAIQQAAIERARAEDEAHNNEGHR